MSASASCVSALYVYNNLNLHTRGHYVTVMSPTQIFQHAIRRATSPVAIQLHKNILVSAGSMSSCTESASARGKGELRE
jgi:hypothetical protein